MAKEVIKSMKMVVDDSGALSDEIPFGAAAANVDYLEEDGTKVSVQEKISKLAEAAESLIPTATKTYTEDSPFLLVPGISNEITDTCTLKKDVFYSFSFDFEGEIPKNLEVGLLGDEVVVDFINSGKIWYDNFYFQCRADGEYSFYFNDLGETLVQTTVWNVKIVKGFSPEHVKTIEELKKVDKEDYTRPNLIIGGNNYTKDHPWSTSSSETKWHNTGMTLKVERGVTYCVSGIVTNGTGTNSNFGLFSNPNNPDTGTSYKTSNLRDLVFTATADATLTVMIATIAGTIVGNSVYEVKAELGKYSTPYVPNIDEVTSGYVGENLLVGMNSWRGVGKEDFLAADTHRTTGAYVQLEKGEVYTASGNVAVSSGACTVALWKDNVYDPTEKTTFVFLNASVVGGKSVQPVKKFTFVAPETGKYYVVAYCNSNSLYYMGDIKIEKGAIATRYVENIEQKDVIRPNILRGGNSYKKETPFHLARTGNGTAYSGTYFDVEEGKIYTLSCEFDNIFLNDRSNSQVYLGTKDTDIEHNSIHGFTYHQASNGYPFKAKATQRLYWFFAIRPSNQVTSYNVWNLKIEEGTGATDYVECIEDKVESKEYVGKNLVYGANGFTEDRYYTKNRVKIDEIRFVNTGIYADLKAGQTYTFSANIKSGSTVWIEWAPLMADGVSMDGSHSFVDYCNHASIPEGTYIKKTLPFTGTPQVSGRHYLWITGAYSDTGNGISTIKSLKPDFNNLKIEEGVNSTAWCPNYDEEIEEKVNPNLLIGLNDIRKEGDQWTIQTNLNWYNTGGRVYLEKGKTYTISAKIPDWGVGSFLLADRVFFNGTTTPIYGYYSNYEKHLEQNGGPTDILPITFTVTEDSRWYYFCVCSCYSVATSTGASTIYYNNNFYDIKIEEGGHATDYVPNLEYMSIPEKGGVNLLKGTRDWSGAFDSRNQQGDYTVVSLNWDQTEEYVSTMYDLRQGVFTQVALFTNLVLPKNTYVFSFEAMGTGKLSVLLSRGTMIEYTKFVEISGGYITQYSNQMLVNFILTPDCWKKYYMIVHMGDDDNNHQPIASALHIYGNAGSYAMMRKPMLEEGAIAHDWSPSPVDPPVQSGIGLNIFEGSDEYTYLNPVAPIVGTKVIGKVALTTGKTYRVTYDTDDGMISDTDTSPYLLRITHPSVNDDNFSCARTMIISPKYSAWYNVILYSKASSVANFRGVYNISITEDFTKYKFAMDKKNGSTTVIPDWRELKDTYILDKKQYSFVGEFFGRINTSNFILFYRPSFLAIGTGSIVYIRNIIIDNNKNYIRPGYYRINTMRYDSEDKNALVIDTKSSSKNADFLGYSYKIRINSKINTITDSYVELRYANAKTKKAYGFDPYTIEITDRYQCYIDDTQTGDFNKNCYLYCSSVTGDGYFGRAPGYYFLIDNNATTNGLQIDAQPKNLVYLGPSFKVLEI